VRREGMSVNGYAGKILRLDLTGAKSRVAPLPSEWPAKYLGGRGFVARILYDEVAPTTGAFDEGNIVIMAAGPLSGLFLPGSGKVHFGTKSPATGGYADSNMGGHLAPEIKYAGYDAMVFEGRAARPVTVVIDDDQVRFADATRHWGKGCLETESALKKELGEDFQIAVIGPAGEKMVRFACIGHDFGRQAGRTGVGAVLGSKNVKAIAVRGTGSIPLADPAGALAKGRQMYDACYAKPGFAEWTPYGTAGVTDWVNEVGAFPTRNFKSGYFDRHKGINGQTLRERILVTDKGCFGCPIPCGKYSRFTFQGREYSVEGPEYETIAMLGGDCGIGEIEEVAYLNWLCDDLGLDTISGGNVAAFALECFANGVIDEERVGRKLAFGDVGSVEYLLRKIAAREGIGAVLAEGVKYAAATFGGGSEKYAIHVKGLEFSGYEPRYAPAMLLSYMTADVGAHHNRSWAITHDVAVGRDKIEGKARKVIELQHTRPLFDALGICRLQWVEIGFELTWYEELFPLVTGLHHTWADLLRCSERIWNLTRAFNVRHIPGFGRNWDLPPARFCEEPMPDGPAKGKFTSRADVDRLLDEYYQLRGWNANGIPGAQKLAELELGDVAADLNQLAADLEGEAGKTR
jgi:aldehyde:ferredoxin oxidoreductase